MSPLEIYLAVALVVAMSAGVDQSTGVLDPAAVRALSGGAQ